MQSRCVLWRDRGASFLRLGWPYLPPTAGAAVSVSIQVFPEPQEGNSWGRVRGPVTLQSAILNEV